MHDAFGMAVDPKTCHLVGVFAANVKRLRNNLGLSQEDLSEKAGVHRTYIGMVERREKNVTIYNIERLAKALGTSAAELLTDRAKSGRR